MGLLGTDITADSNRVWITKTHYPKGVPNVSVFNAQKMIVMARNPIDVIPSFAGLYQLNSHSLEINESYPVDFPEYWDSWVQ